MQKWQKIRCYRSGCNNQREVLPLKNDKDKVNSTFVIKFKNKKDRNWNGKIVLADSNQEKDFNGVMELIRIIENMLDEKSGVQVSHYVGKNN